jgi:hypothetical protein
MLQDETDFRAALRLEHVAEEGLGGKEGSDGFVDLGRQLMVSIMRVG